MFRKILIANRGEIAMRIIRGCRELNIATAAIYSEADSSGIYVKKADESYLVGPGPVKGFLDGKQIVEIAKRIGADAIHPGYGFLSENTKFARLCQTSGITFIGPSPETIDLMGSKVKARQIAQQAGVPIVPGTEGGVTSVDDALAFAHQINYPVMIKASAGGGGRGLRVVRSDQELRENIDVASREAQAAFGDGSIFIEKYIERPHHIEFQILGDKHGNIIHLGERDCSIQRRHQKLIEIAPSLILTPKLRAQMGEAAIAIAKAVHYDNAGTVEFLLDHEGHFYFMEMNPRLQVEHTVTEQITAIDIVRNQISIAAGKPSGDPAKGCDPAGPCDSVPHQCRRPPQQLHALYGHHHRLLCHPAGSGSASTARFIGITRFLPTTMRCWRNSPSAGAHGKRPSAACGARWKNMSCAG
jgi:pyruvate carboxylase subunit A